MRVVVSALAVLAAVGLLAACDRQASESEAPTAAATAAPPAVAVAGAAAPTGFTVEQVPVTTAALPPFPMFATPEGLASIYSDKDRDRGFDRQHFIAGDRIVAVEGKLHRDGFALENEGRRYSELEFQRNYENAITALGGVKISTVQFTPAVLDAFGGRDKVEQHYEGACAAGGCHIDTYLIRSGDKEYWINVSTGRIPPHGYVTVLERQAMKQSLGYLSADEMKAALDEKGRVALYINFDFDRATVRPDDKPAIDEIARLLKANPTLRLSIEGHTDNVGAAARNRSLSTERAAAVRTALIAQGIAPERLSAAGFGADRPVASNADEAGRARNRRVELVKL